MKYITYLIFLWSCLIYAQSQQEYASGDLGLEYATEVKKDIAWGKN